SCTDELLKFSSCLPYVAVSPNNVSESAPSRCCEVVVEAFRDGSAVCFCYLVSRPSILGFPLNSTKVSTLSAVCQHSESNSSLGPVCSGSSML
ncbi:hypothetical protein M569_01548, partial [Genlisea aurea]